MNLRIHFGIIRKLNYGFQLNWQVNCVPFFLLDAAFAKGILSDEFSLGSMEFVTGLFD